MSQPARFQRGDRVVHPRKPEWGDGVVREARQVTHQGQPAQRLTVQFANQGRKVINTAVAPLEPREQVPTQSASPGSPGLTGAEGPEQDASMTQTNTSQQGGWIESLERSVRGGGHELWELPEAMSDPFAGFERQLHATLDAYRFSTEPRPLIDWAVMQTGLNDPLSRYTRPELEQAFPGFARNRDQHLKQLARQIKQAGESHLLDEARRTTRHPEARKVLDKAMQG